MNIVVIMYEIFVKIWEFICKYFNLKRNIILSRYECFNLLFYNTEISGENFLQQNTIKTPWNVSS